MVLGHKTCERCTEIRIALGKPPRIVCGQRFGMDVCRVCEATSKAVVDTRKPYWLVCDERQGKA